jgi:hypothetical protein
MDLVSMQTVTFEMLTGGMVFKAVASVGLILLQEKWCLRCTCPTKLVKFRVAVLEAPIWISCLSSLQEKERLLPVRNLMQEASMPSSWTVSRAVWNIDFKFNYIL